MDLNKYKRFTDQTEDYERFVARLERRSKEGEPSGYAGSRNFEIASDKYPKTKVREKIIGYVSLEQD